MLIPLEISQNLKLNEKKYYKKWYLNQERKNKLNEKKESTNQ
jgi:hypothetical protein